MGNVSNGWAIEASRVPLHTTDGGNTWQPLDAFPAGVQPAANSTAWINASTGWQLVANTAGTYDLQQTRDGGATWTTIKTVTWSGSLDFVDEQNGWAIARLEDAVALLKTSNGGITWQEIKPVVASND
jgi:photosystem II stability/assembly factor-like uncharacterized protein